MQKLNLRNLKIQCDVYIYIYIASIDIIVVMSFAIR